LLGLIDDTHAALKNLSNDFVAELGLNREQTAHRVMLWQWSVKSSIPSPARPGTAIDKVFVRRVGREWAQGEGPES